MVEKTLDKVKKLYSYLIVIFVFLIIYFVVTAFFEIMRSIFLFFVIVAFLFLISGISMLLLVSKSSIRGCLRVFLIFMGVSSTGFLISIFLHNFVYGLFIFFFGDNFWTNSGIGDEPVFFIFGILICPLLFLIGSVGSSIMFSKRKK